MAYWKNIIGFPEYIIDTLGRVWSKKNGKFLKGQLTGELNRGYKTVVLYENKKRYSKKIHRLVLETFVGKCPDDKEACHYNGVRTDNRLSNLRWDTRKNNSADAIRHGTHVCLTQKGESHSQSKLTEQDVLGICELWISGQYKQKDIAKIYSTEQSVVSRIVNKKRWKHIWSR